jgi:hypothetical protein
VQRSSSSKRRCLSSCDVTRGDAHEISLSAASPSVPIPTPRASCHLAPCISRARNRKRRCNHPPTNPSQRAGLLLHARDSAGANLCCSCASGTPGHRKTVLELFVLVTGCSVRPIWRAHRGGSSRERVIILWDVQKPMIRINCEPTNFH